MDLTQLRGYVDACRQQGCTDADIQQALQQAGWDESVISSLFQQIQPEIPVEALVPLPTQPQQSPVKPKKSFRIVGFSLLGIFLALVILVGVSEAGYFPAFSRLYRKTPLPLLWHGTSGNVALSMGKMLQTTGTTTTFVLNAQEQVTLTSASGASTAEIPNLNKGLALLTKKSSGSTQAFADVPSNLVKLPLTIQVQSSLAKDNNQNLDAVTQINLASLVANVPILQNYINPQFSQLNVEQRILTGTNALYLQTNVLPVLNATDIGKWLKLVLPEPDKNITSDVTINSALQIGSFKTEIAILNQIGKDEGIVRHNGVASAYYQLVFNQAMLKKLEQLQSLAAYKEDLQQFEDSQIAVTLDIYIQPHSGLLQEVDGTVVYTGGADSPYDVTLTTKSTLSTVGTTVIAPPANQILTDNIGAYLTSLSGHQAKDFANTGILNDDSLNLILNFAGSDPAALKDE